MFRKKCNKTAAVSIGLIMVTIIAGFVFFQKEINSENFKDLSAAPIEKTTKEQVEELGPLSILVDKKKYKKGDLVQVNIINNTTKPMIQDPESFVDIFMNQYLGDNIGVALIEKKIENEWETVDSLWRCDISCNELCNSIPPLRPSENKQFTWDQMLTKCVKDDGEQAKVPAKPGLYRIGSGVDGGQNQVVYVYSDEFIIEEDLTKANNGLIYK